MDPALCADRGPDADEPGVPVEHLDLVVRLELTDLRAADLVWRVREAHEPVADPPAFRAERRLAERELPRRLDLAALAPPARSLERRAPPARQVRLAVRVVAGREREGSRRLDDHRDVVPAAPPEGDEEQAGGAAQGHERHEQERQERYPRAARSQRPVDEARTDGRPTAGAPDDRDRG